MSEACESNVRACERVKKMLRRLTHAQGVCLGRSGDVGLSPTQGTRTNFSDKRNSGLLIKENSQFMNYIKHCIYETVISNHDTLTRPYIRCDQLLGEVSKH